MKSSLPEAFWHSQLKGKLFPESHSFVPNTTEIFEWELAFMEMARLCPEELIERSAFFSHIAGKPTFHHQLCSVSDASIHEDKSIATQSFFKARQFSTGYATHGLFPYRGKFHPQLVKGLINIIGLKRGDLILDPMAGSGTTGLEARLLGINSIGVDVSPFCTLMAEAKAAAMEIEPRVLHLLIPDKLRLLDFMAQPSSVKDLPVAINKKLQKLGFAHNDSQVNALSKLLLLIYLDAMGYARRRATKTLKELFVQVFARYVATISNFGKVARQLNLQLGTADFLCASALSLPIADASIDAIITSPPYSFAIDYADNDKPQLEFLGHNVAALKERMIGLRGRTKHDKIESYFADMHIAIREISRVLKRGKMCVIVIGSNDIQTGGIRHEAEIKRFAKDAELELRKELIKPIKGIQNTMHEEFILFFQKVA
jgi:SAM-dependent methyltransferase